MDPARARHETPGDAPADGERIRAAEVIAALSLATDLGIGVPLEHGLDSTVIAMRIVEQAGLDDRTASQVYYSCLLFYVGCTANADVADALFGGHDVLTTHGGPVRHVAIRPTATADASRSRRYEGVRDQVGFAMVSNLASPCNQCPDSRRTAS